MTHPVMWFEVLGTDGGKLRKFYGDLFGWTFDVIPQIDYGLVKTGDTRGIMGGIGGPYAGTTNTWVVPIRSGIHGRRCSASSPGARPGPMPDCARVNRTPVC